MAGMPSASYTFGPGFVYGQEGIRPNTRSRSSWRYWIYNVLHQSQNFFPLLVMLIFLAVYLKSIIYALNATGDHTVLFQISSLTCMRVGEWAKVIAIAYTCWLIPRCDKTWRSMQQTFIRRLYLRGFRSAGRMMRIFVNMVVVSVLISSLLYNVCTINSCSIFMSFYSSSSSSPGSL